MSWSVAHRYSGVLRTSPVSITSGFPGAGQKVLTEFRDTEPRERLSEAEVAFLGRTAAQIVTYLDTNRQAIEGSRVRALATGLESFIAGKKSIHDKDVNGTTRNASMRKSAKAYGINIPPRPETSLPSSPTKPARSHSLKAKTSLDSIPSETATSEVTTDSDEQKIRDLDDESTSHAKTFARAANLLRESFGDLGEDGAVVFMSLKGRLNMTSRSPFLEKSPRRSPLDGRNWNHSAASRDADCDSAQPVLGAQVLASSTWSSPLAASGDSNVLSVKLGDSALREIIQRYPGGKIWSLDEPAKSSSDEDDATYGKDIHPLPRPKRSSRRKRDETMVISLAFPHARQVLFTPTWDSSVGGFQQAVFVAASSITRSLTVTTELSFLNSYCSTVMAECSRIDATKADRIKADFVGTFSHEMRSPLHGVLASAEFLADTELSPFQDGLVDTIEACGRTLLDTINHVLDFSKVNSFQKNWEASNKRKKNHYLGPENTSRSLTLGAPPLLQLFAVTDISAVLEEVVDGLVMGQTFNSAVDIMDMSREARGRGKKNQQVGKIPQEDVRVVLDVQQADWAFLTQPGAVRRIVLNVTGNALKYTNHGIINICLELEPGETERDAVMVLRVTDTGKGISQEFLSTKLFVPFAQENALAPGTGLGMSIVHSIITMLGGTIDVKSHVGKGTTVEVALPLKRPLPGQTSTTTTPHSGGTTSSSGSRPDEAIQLLQNQVADSTVAYYRKERTLANDHMNEILCRYVREWYGIEFVSPEVCASANIVIAEEEDLEALMDHLVGTPCPRPALIVLCSVASRHSASYTSMLETRINGAVCFLSEPLGPYK